MELFVWESVSIVFLLRVESRQKWSKLKYHYDYYFNESSIISSFSYALLLHIFIFNSPLNKHIHYVCTYAHICNTNMMNEK